MNKVIVLSACIIILHVMLTIPIIHSTDLMYINKIMPRTGYPINITGDAIIAGNVGINTTTPTAKLDVAGGYIKTDTGFCIGENCITNLLKGNGTQNYLTKWITEIP